MADLLYEEEKKKDAWSLDGAKWKPEIATENFKLFLSYRGHADPWRRNAIKMEDARFGKQYSDAEAKELLAFRQAPLPISVSTAISDTADALMISTQPTVHVSPIIYAGDEPKTQQSRMVAQKFSTLIEKAWNDSLGNLQYDRVVRDSGNVGHGLFYVVPRNEFGEFFVDVKHLSWRYYFPDPASKDPLYRDQDNSIYALKLSKKAGFKYLRGIEPSISYENYEEEFVKGSEGIEGDLQEDALYGFKGRSGDEKDGDVFLIHRPQLEEESVYIVVPLYEYERTGSTLGYKTYPAITPELEQMARDKRIKIVRRKRYLLSEYISLGRLGFKRTYPVSNYNIIPLTHDHRDTPYPYSRMWYLYPLQRALNKFMMSAVLNTSLLNSTRVLAEEGSIVNMKNWVMNSSMPGSVLQYKLPVPGQSQPPQVIQAQPLGEAWLTMPRYLTSMMEYISGIFGTMMGNPEGTPDVFSTVASLQSAGGMKIKRRMVHADATLSAVGEVMGEYYKEYAPPSGFTSSFNAETGEDEVIEYNKIKVEEVDGKYKATIDPQSDLSQGFRRVRFTSSKSAGYESATEAALLTQLATTLQQPALLPFILERINFRDSNKAMKMVDVTEQLKGQLGQAEKVIKDLESKTSSFQNQIFGLVKTLEGARHKGQLAVELEKFKNNPQQYLEQSINNQGAN